MREACLGLATGAGRAKSQADPFAVAQRAGCKSVRQPRQSGRRCRNAGRMALRTALGGSGDQQPECPDRASVGVAAIGSRQHPSLHLATDPPELFAQPERRLCARCGPRNGGETVSQGPGGKSQSLQIEIVMRPVTSPVHECRLRCQFRFLDQRGNRRG